MKINDIMHSLRSVLADWPQCLANPRYARVGNKAVAWSDYAYRISDYPIMASDVTQLTEQRQYTFQMIQDGSLIQIYYQFNQQETAVEAANLTFYSSQSIAQTKPAYKIAIEELQLDLEDPDDLALYEAFGDEIDVPGEQADGPVGWLRIDYAPHQARGVLHYDCHMHISAFPESRFVVAGLPTPKQFIELIIALFYPEAYAAHRLNDDGHYPEGHGMREVNSPCIRMDNDLFRYMAHLRIPTDRP